MLFIPRFILLDQHKSSTTKSCREATEAFTLHKYRLFCYYLSGQWPIKIVVFLGASKNLYWNRISLENGHFRKIFVILVPIFSFFRIFNFERLEFVIIAEHDIFISSFWFSAGRQTVNKEYCREKGVLSCFTNKQWLSLIAIAWRNSCKYLFWYFQRKYGMTDSFCGHLNSNRVNQQQQLRTKWSCKWSRQLFSQLGFKISECGRCKRFYVVEIFIIGLSWQ